MPLAFFNSMFKELQHNAELNILGTLAGSRVMLAFVVEQQFSLSSLCYSIPFFGDGPSSAPCGSPKPETVQVTYPNVFCFSFILVNQSKFVVFFFVQLPEEGQKWGFLIWLMFSYSGLFCIAFFCVGKVCLRFLYFLIHYVAILERISLYCLLRLFFLFFILILLSSGQWLSRRQAHMLRAHQGGIPISEYRVIILPKCLSNMCYVFSLVVNGK